jgi:hypothetical protein
MFDSKNLNQYLIFFSTRMFILENQIFRIYERNVTQE